MLWSKVAILGMVIPPSIGILIMGPYKPLLLGWWVYPLLYGNNGSGSTLAHMSVLDSRSFHGIVKPCSLLCLFPSEESLDFCSKKTASKTWRVLPTPDAIMYMVMLYLPSFGLILPLEIIGISCQLRQRSHLWISSAEKFARLKSAISKARRMVWYQHSLP